MGKEVKQIMFDHTYWEQVTIVVKIYEPLYIFVWIMDLEVVPTMSFVYKLICMMKENLNLLEEYFMGLRYHYWTFG